MRPVRILRVITRLNVGGPARQVISLARGLDRRGFRTVLAIGRPGPGEGDLTALARDAGVEVVLVPGLGRAPRALDGREPVSGRAAALGARGARRAVNQ